MPSIGWSNFAAGRHHQHSGNSFSLLTNDEVVRCVKNMWIARYKADGEADPSRKVLVPLRGSIPGMSEYDFCRAMFENENKIAIGKPVFFCPSILPIKEGMSICAKVIKRQDGEDPYIENYIRYEDAKKFGFDYIPASYCDVVCYNREALKENGGECSGDFDWEIVCLLARQTEKVVLPEPLTMARNFLEKIGGTKSFYTVREFAESIYNTRGFVQVRFE